MQEATENFNFFLFKLTDQREIHEHYYLSWVVRFENIHKIFCQASLRKHKILKSSLAKGRAGRRITECTALQSGLPPPPPHIQTHTSNIHEYATVYIG